MQDDLSTLAGTADLASMSSLALLGLFLIVALDSRKIPGAIVIGLLTVLLGWIVARPLFAVSGQSSFNYPSLYAVDLETALDLSMVSIIFSLPLVDLFDATGTNGIADMVHRVKKAKSIG